MNFTELKSYFVFTKSQRIGIVTLFVMIITGQLLLFWLNSADLPDTEDQNAKLASIQAEMDSLKLLEPSKPKVYPFNPNFITDYKGYKLGMSVDEIDRLLAFRKTDKYVNSAAEFQSVTKVSDSLLQTMSPLFKFPDWVKHKKIYSHEMKFSKKEKNAILMDINQATAEDLIKVYGIGPAFSERILKQRALLGGFTIMDQLLDVWGLSAETVVNLKKSFNVLAPSDIKKININTASLKELSQFPYFRYPLSKAIVTYRSMNGDIKNADDLNKIPNFPVEKIERIAVYLEF